MTNPSRVPVLLGIQQLRFFAAAAVVYGHSLHEASTRLNWKVSGLEHFNWNVGVDIFFVISGFIMMYTFGEEFGSFRRAAFFITRRVLRVAPLYWIFILLNMVAVLGVRTRVVHNAFDWKDVTRSLLFVPYQRGDGLFRPILALGWTLNYEMFFYALFSLGLLLPKQSGVAALILSLLLLVGLHPLVLHLAGPLEFWTDPIILEFLAGIVVAHFARNIMLFVRHRGVSSIIGGIAVAALVFEAVHPLIGYWRSAVLGVPAVAIFISFLPLAEGVAPNKSFLNNLLKSGGDASYVLYLCHPFILNIMSLLWLRLHFGGQMIFALFATLASIVGSLVIFRYVDAPIQTVVRKSLKGRSSAAKVGAAA